MGKLKVFKNCVKDRMETNELNLIRAIIYELDMMFNVMGPDLYFKYATGTAIEGVDFF